MHFGAKVFQALLMRDSEMLLLVYDDEPEILKADSLAEHGVGADDDVQRSIGQSFLCLPLLGGADHAGQLADAHRQALKSLREILKMLAGKERRRHDDRGLLAVDCRSEGGA